MRSKLDFPLGNIVGEEGAFIDFQLCFSTADIAASVFYGDIAPLESIYVSPQVSPGGYYLLEGELRPIVDAGPPGSIPLSEQSGLYRLLRQPE